MNQSKSNNEILETDKYIDALLNLCKQQHKALQLMEKEFGYSVVHEKAMVHDEHTAIQSAIQAIKEYDNFVQYI